MKKLFLVLIGVIGFGVSANGQVGARTTDRIASICPPLNWEVSYGVFKGPIEQGVDINSQIQTKMEIGAGSRSVKKLSDFVDIEVKLLGTNLVSRSSFKTNKGLVGEKVVWKTTSGFDYYRTPVLKIQYFFYRGNDEYSNCAIITCTVVESKASKYTSLFDESARTFEHAKK